MRDISLGLLLLAGLTAPALGQTPTFTKIADTTTVAPDSGCSLFSIFGDAREIANGKVAFYAYHGSGSGIYTFQNGVLARFVDTNTVVPGTSSTFSTFFDVSIDGGVSLRLLAVGQDQVAVVPLTEVKAFLRVVSRGALIPFWYATVFLFPTNVSTAWS